MKVTADWGIGNNRRPADMVGVDSGVFKTGDAGTLYDDMRRLVAFIKQANGVCHDYENRRIVLTFSRMYGPASYLHVCLYGLSNLERWGFSEWCSRDCDPSSLIDGMLRSAQVGRMMFGDAFRVLSRRATHCRSLLGDAYPDPFGDNAPYEQLLVMADMLAAGVDNEYTSWWPRDDRMSWGRWFLSA